ncbi:hypothetical protein [Chitinophaga filiformis]|uniref:Uncharacterized protein n=1 Tax=Chitinophaga filiformis TaxID=104663 RepID=A0ABY4I0M8_CHIFI|nr:hypothetical protein [Chitinophaga filiformis]UPK68306.1 hypothetical protein MYF79_25445 [Chitinophaga filiformis]
MPYPSRLVPRSNHKYIPQPNEEELLCRWVPPNSELKDSEGNLAAEAINDKEIFTYSVNKIPDSDVDDIFIEFICEDKHKFYQKWNEGEDGYTPQDAEFTYNHDRGYFLFKIRDIQYSDTYPYPNLDGEHAYRFVVTAKHDPLISNICHFELDVDFRNLDGSQVEQKPGQRSHTRKLIQAEIRQKLIKISKFSIEEFEIDPQSD